MYTIHYTYHGRIGYRVSPGDGCPIAEGVRLLLLGLPGEDVARGHGCLNPGHMSGIHAIGIGGERGRCLGAASLGISEGDIETGLAYGVTHVDHFLCHY